MWLDHTRHKHLGLFDHRSEEASRAKIGCGLIKRTVNQQTILPNRNMKLVGLVRLLKPNASQNVTEYRIGTLRLTEAGVPREKKFRYGKCVEHRHVEYRRFPIIVL